MGFIAARAWRHIVVAEPDGVGSDSATNFSWPRSIEAVPRMQTYSSFREFYPFYLSEHAKRTTRRLHFLGSSLALLCIAALTFTGNSWWLLAGLVAGYGFAWFAHFRFEKNRPATFQYPLYSFMGDWVMFWQILTGKIAF